MLGYLLRYVVKRFDLKSYARIIILTDKIPVKKMRKVIEKAVKTTLREMLPDRLGFSVLHHSSKSNFGLQIADYCNWAIYRKWSRGDNRSYDIIKRAIRSEFDIFQMGSVFYY